MRSVVCLGEDICILIKGLTEGTTCNKTSKSSRGNCNRQAEDSAHICIQRHLCVPGTDAAAVTDANSPESPLCNTLSSLFTHAT